MSTMPKAPVRPPAPPTSSGPLEHLIGSSPDFVGAVLLTRQGAVVSHVGGPEELLMKLAPFAIGLLELAERAAEEAGQGGFGSTLVQSEDGHLGLHAVGDDHLVFALAASGAPLGLIRHDLEATARELARKL